MKRKDWFLVIVSLLLVVFIDQLSKRWSINLPEKWYGFIHLILIHNHGAMLGLFSELPAVLRIVTLSTSGVFILSIYAIIQYMIPQRLLGLRVGLSLLVGGILGNVLDRILYGYVIDFMAVQIGSWHSPIWNFADVIQWVGYAIIVVNVVKHGEILWPGNNIRKVFWVNKRFQIKYSALFMCVGLFLTLISLVFSYTYLKVTIEEISGQNPILIQKFSQPFLYSFLVLAVTFSIVLFGIGKMISHRIAGPLYAFERFLTEILDGKGLTKNGAALKLRAGDDFKHLEALAEKIKAKLLKMHSEKVIATVEYKEDEK